MLARRSTKLTSLRTDAGFHCGVRWLLDSRREDPRFMWDLRFGRCWEHKDDTLYWKQAKIDASEIYYYEMGRRKGWVEYVDDDE